MKKVIHIVDSIFALIATVLFLFVAVGEYTLPDNVVTYDSEKAVFSSVYVCDYSAKTESVGYINNGSSNQQIRLFGMVPVKSVSVSNSESQTVLVSGEPFGIKLYTDGVIVVGTQDVDTGSKKENPAKEAGIEVGDIIVSINNTNVYTSDEVKAILNDNNGKPYNIKIKRNNRYKNFVLTPVFSPTEDCYKAGMWVRDSTAGIGTITFYNKSTGTFGALGHQINDVDTNEIMPMLEGEAVKANITKIQKSTTSSVGSFSCDFQDYTIGKLTKNTEYGVYGTYSSIVGDTLEYTVASKQEIKRGSAQIITTVDNSSPKAYDIEITSVSYNSKNDTKNMVIKITDEELIEKTGGIVQGMSGSPIIQNGKLVGAVTHVIVNNPKKGYAIFAQTMLEMSNTDE